MIWTRIPRTLTRPGLVLALALGFALAPGRALAQAQSERPPATPGAHEWHPEALKAIDLLKSPYCPGFMLEVCPSPGGTALRDTIEMMAEAGAPADSIVESIISRYGEEWRALPKTSGEALLAWVIPPLALIFGIVIVVLVLRKIRKPRGAPVTTDVSDEERARLDAALREIEAEDETRF